MTSEEEYKKLIELENLYKKSLFNLEHFIGEFLHRKIEYFDQFIKLNNDIIDAYKNMTNYQRVLKVKYNFDNEGVAFAAYFKKKFLEKEE